MREIAIYPVVLNSAKELSILHMLFESYGTADRAIAVVLSLDKRMPVLSLEELAQ
jgi:hypothetical protein